MRNKNFSRVPNKMPGTGKPPVKFANGDNQKQVQHYNNMQLYSKGFSYGVNPGPNTESPVLGGAARRLHGIVLFTESAFVNDQDIISLTVNNEVLIDNVLALAYNPTFSGNLFKTEQFFALPRGLSGSDSVSLVYNSVNAHKINIIFYLSDLA